MARLSVIGMWHLGCVAAGVLAEMGHAVRGTDLDPEVLGQLHAGTPPVYEPGLAELLVEQIRRGRFALHSPGAEAFAGAEYIIVAVDTPVDATDQSDLSPIVAAIDAIGEHARSELQIVVMSQVPVGTCRHLAERLRGRAPKLRFTLAYQPENLRLGQALEAFRHPDFLLVGAEEPTAVDCWLRLFEQIEAPRLVTNWASAELAKQALNAFLATSISFANELAGLAEACGADVRIVVQALRRDRRVGPHAFLSPGLGYSGGTLGRDVQSLRALGKRLGRKTLQLDATLAVNEFRLPHLLETFRRACQSIGTCRVALLGLTYKPGTSVLRRSRALALAGRLRDAGAEVRAFDPQVREPRSETDGILLCADAYAAAERADVLLVATPWPEFARLDFERLRQVMRQPVLIDAHNCLDDQAARRAGFSYFGVGISGEASSATRMGAGA